MVVSAPANLCMAPSSLTGLAQMLGGGQDRIHRLAGRPAVAIIGAGFQYALQRAPGAADAALHRANRAAADLGRLLVGETAGANQDQRLALFGRQHPKTKA